MGEKQFVRKSIEDLNIDMLTIDAVVQKFNEFAKIAGGVAKVDFYSRWEGDTSFSIEYEALETDEEVQDRIRNTHNCETRMKNIRKKEWEKLNKEFGK